MRTCNRDGLDSTASVTSFNLMPISRGFQTRQFALPIYFPLTSISRAQNCNRSIFRSTARSIHSTGGQYCDWVSGTGSRLAETPRLSIGSTSTAILMSISTTRWRRLCHRPVRAFREQTLLRRHASSFPTSLTGYGFNLFPGFTFPLTRKCLF